VIASPFAPSSWSVSPAACVRDVVPTVSRDWQPIWAGNQPARSDRPLLLRLHVAGRGAHEERQVSLRRLPAGPRAAATAGRAAWDVEAEIGQKDIKGRFQRSGSRAVIPRRVNVPFVSRGWQTPRVASSPMAQIGLKPIFEW
jgi:hypothetical protein